MKKHVYFYNKTKLIAGEIKMPYIANTIAFEQIDAAIKNKDNAEFLRITDHPTMPIYSLEVLIKKFPGLKDDILAIALSSEENFRYYTQHPTMPIYSAEVFIQMFPECQEAILDMMVTTKENFLHIVRHPTNSVFALGVLSAKFPQVMAALGINIEEGNITVEKALEEVEKLERYQQSKGEIIEKSRIISQGTRTAGNFFAGLPQDKEGILGEIAGYTGIHGAHNLPGKKDPDQIGKENLNKPIAPK